ncbi:MAG: hypothetical protein GY773_34245, partial [Actinomycetia bacterium]|nr:hypothetical protein [Actinomycetes bacterium]
GDQGEAGDSAGDESLDGEGAIVVESTIVLEILGLSPPAAVTQLPSIAPPVDPESVPDLVPEVPINEEMIETQAVDQTARNTATAAVPVAPEAPVGAEATAPQPAEAAPQPAEAAPQPAEAAPQPAEEIMPSGADSAGPPVGGMSEDLPVTTEPHGQVSPPAPPRADLGDVTEVVSTPVAAASALVSGQPVEPDPGASEQVLEEVPGPSAGSNGLAAVSMPPSPSAEPQSTEPVIVAEIQAVQTQPATGDVVADSVAPAAPRAGAPIDPGMVIVAPESVVDAAGSVTPAPEVAEASAARPATTQAEVPGTPAQQVAQALRDVRRLADGSHRLSLQLHPKELGVVQIEVALRDGQIHMRAVAETESTRGLLSGSLPELRGELTEAGVSAGSLEVGAETADQSGRRSPSSDRTDDRAALDSDSQSAPEITDPAPTTTADGRLDVRL